MLRNSFDAPMMQSENPDQDALNLAILVSQQEAEFGINMYEALQPEDEFIIGEFIKLGYTLDEAVLEIFDERVSF